MSAAQIAANRANALHSTGPRTAHGKRESSRNAIRHGLTARHTVLSVEDRDAYDDLRAELMREHCPQSTQETLLVTQIIDSLWRLQCARALETALFERDLIEGADPAMGLLGTFEQNGRQFDNLRRYAAGPPAATAVFVAHASTRAASAFEPTLNGTGSARQRVARSSTKWHVPVPLPNAGRLAS